MLAWFRQLDKAADAAEVAAIARDYFAGWSPEEIGRLPESCRPGRIRSASDLERMHASTVEAFRTTPASDESLKALQIIASFLVRANLRIVQLQAAGQDEGRATPPRLSRSREP